MLKVLIERNELLTDVTSVDGLVQVLTNHVLHNRISSTNIIALMNRYPECTYSGELYRMIIINEDELRDEFSNRTTQYNLIEYLQSYIERRKDYVSSTKDYDSIKPLFKKLSDDPKDKYFVIKFTSDGLDINKLIERCKYYDIDKKYISEIRKLESYYDDKEVLARVTSFDVIDYNGQPLIKSEDLIDLY